MIKKSPAVLILENYFLSISAEKVSNLITEKDGANSWKRVAQAVSVG